MHKKIKQLMDDLKEIYERIKFLRGKGVKMKEIAAQTGFYSERAVGPVHHRNARIF